MKKEFAKIIMRLSKRLKLIYQFINERQMLKFLIENYLWDIWEIIQIIIGYF